MFQTAAIAAAAREEAIANAKIAADAAKKAATVASVTNKKVDSVATVVQTLETNTNSLKDALIDVTEREAYARGQRDLQGAAGA